MRRLISLAATAALSLAVLPALGAAPATAATAPYTVQTLHFKVKVGPNRDQACDVVGDLYTPRAASSTRRMPAIMATNGFGGSKDDQAGIGKAFASRGYVVLSYSGLGFGGSTCKITLDDRDYDGAAGSQLISYLGGATGIAYLDAGHTQAAPRLNVVRLDARAHDGTRRAHDPRVGMIGGSYGGQIQFAIAGIDPRLDTIIPIITWNDLSYSLGPNNTSQTSGVSTRVPGAVKLAWGLGFSALGMVGGLQHAQEDPARLLPCPNFASFVCPALVTGGTLGFFQPSAVNAMRHASVATFMPKIKIPVFLWQGELDTLFNLNEAIATYQALRAQGTPVKMIWQRWGHSALGPQPGEVDLGNANPTTQYETGRALAWFEHYLKGRSVSTGPGFAYFRNWVKYTGNASPAYAAAPAFPVGKRVPYYLSGGGLTTSKTGLVRSTKSFLTPVVGVPTRLEELDAVGQMFTLPLPEDDLPGTFASWQTAPLGSARAVVGSPKLTLKVNAPLATLTQSLGATGKLVLFVRIQDVGTDGKASDIDLLTAPVRVEDVRKPFTVTLPAFVHRFAKGHRIRLVVAGGSVNYRGGLTANPVMVTSGSTSQVLSLPIV